MGKEVILAIFHISVALAAETEFQRRIIQIRASAHRTLMLVERSTVPTHLRRLRLCAKITPALILGGRYPVIIPCGKEKQEKIHQ